MPLCTVFTKCPAPSGPRRSTQGSPLYLAAISRRIGFNCNQLCSVPPTIIDGPNRAPSSPPETPIPTKCRSCFASSALRRRVSWKFALPPSMIVSPGDNSGKTVAIMMSIGLVDGIMNRITRGVCRPSTKLSSVVKACRLPDRSSASFMNSPIQEVSRLVTATSKPLSAMFSASALPIVPSPKIPICAFSMRKSPD